MRIKIMIKGKRKAYADIPSLESIVVHHEEKLSFYYRRIGVDEYQPMTKIEVGKVIDWMKKNKVAKRDLTLTQVDEALR